MMRQPENMDELVYFTNRTIGTSAVRVWVFRKDCPKCGKALMGKPTHPDGRIKVRAGEYVCPECGFAVPKQEYEDSLTACVDYTCPSCGNEGEAEIPFKRKSINGVPTLRVDCSKCGTHIDVTKKMKKPK
jgi:predicted RNA-binding Zn-ribbon protein involved in translation (DUF1610 family)